MDRTSLLALQHVLADTTNFNPDSLKIWYSRIRTVSGDILLAKDYAANGNYSKAREVLDSIVFWHGLVSPTQYGISDMDTIFGILDVRGVDELTSGDINTLLAVSNNYSHAAAMARGILILEGYRFQTQYVIPSSGGEERIALPRPITAALEEITVYPNPNNGDELNIIVPDVFKYQIVSVDFWTLTGTKISSFILSEQYNRFRLPKHPAGLYLFRICGDGTMLKTGRFAILK
jgi:hypothetical protein